jgi:hypothetical protein
MPGRAFICEGFRMTAHPDQFPRVVINRGVGGEDAKEMLARLDKGVIAEHPHLVLWQVGTNAIVDARSSPSRRNWCAPASSASRRPASTSSSSTRNMPRR